VIKNAFQDFYEDVELIEGSDPDKLYEFKRTLDDERYYTRDDIEKIHQCLFRKEFFAGTTYSDPHTVIERFMAGDEAKKEEFRAVLKTFVRVYAFLSQIISFSDSELEKLYVFGKNSDAKTPLQEAETSPGSITAG
jgi:type I restriction enzyme R subunit